MTTKIFNKKEQKLKRNELRNRQTTPEQILWQYIKREQLGVKFRRQHGIGDYIVDFYATKIRLVIEVDGDSHFTENAKEYDKVRTDFFKSLNIEVVRFTNYEVMNNIMGVCQILREIIDRKLLEKLNSTHQQANANPS